MASTTAATPDTMVTIKVNIDGQNKRLKMPLRDLGATTLPAKLRTELLLPSSTKVLFERYSDSAAAFVTLDPNNPSVYKQLYRAAKAKLKLRIKATIIPKEATSARQPTVEDEAPGAESETRPSDTLKTSSTTLPQKKVVAPRKIVSLPVAHTPAQAPKAAQPSVAQIQRGFEDLMVSRSTRQSVLKELDEIMNDVCTYKDTPAGEDLFCSNTYNGGGDLLSTAIPKVHSSYFGSGKSAEPKCYPASPYGALTMKDAVQAPIKQCPYAQANSSFTVFCNHCSKPIVNVHYHCGVCDDGDFDLCLDCTGKGISCSDDNHWMIKRTIENGKVSSSTTETLPPKTTSIFNNLKELDPDEEEQFSEDLSRTCNCCIQEFPEENFVTCTVCEDYDLCIPCHVALQHGHDPKHAFAPAVEDATLDPVPRSLLSPGRNAGHHAICDNCDEYIYGVRHKCLDCPDWDYCASCILNAQIIHPKHRFVPIYEPLGDVHESLRVKNNRVKHAGIYCDGPLCNGANNNTSYIVGDRYKCAVCHDTDFCAACEASPSNQHNKTHPLIKFKTMIRNVSVTTMGDHVDGQRMKVMGDRIARNASKATETTHARSANAATQVQTVADLRPTESIKKEEIKQEIKPEVKEEVKPEIKLETKQEVMPLPCSIPQQSLSPAIVRSPEAVDVKRKLLSMHTPSPYAPYPELEAFFVRDTVEDGTVLPPNHVFEQTWVMRNNGHRVWPAGCSVKFTGGDNMCAVDPEHPLSIRELVSSAESTVCHTDVLPGQEASFTVLMRTPNRAGKIISYWRLTGPTGIKFGHRLWCDVNVVSATEEAPKAEEVPKTEEAPKAEETPKDVQVSQDSDSGMFFPKLPKESPAASVSEAAPSQTSNAAQESEAEEFEDFLEEDEDELDDETEDGFLTDEEYDILDASDEEYLAEQSKGSKK